MLLRLASALLAVTLLLSPRVASAVEVELVVVMWNEDLSVKDTVDQFFKCLVQSSEFGTTWAAQFDLTKVTYKGVYVLSDPCPTEAYQGDNLEALLEAAFDAGTVPPPSAGGTSYLLYLPHGVQGYDWGYVPACVGTYCGVHGFTSYHGTTYDLALVPIDCPDCGEVQVTLIGEHEAAEALANFGTAQFETGDSCEGPSHETFLSCCGTEYPIQELSSAESEYDCQTIDATGSMCWCAAVEEACASAADCCEGLGCAQTVEQTSACCVATGGACATRADCCGGQACTAGVCGCAEDGQVCLTDDDCCGGTCAGGTCATPPPPAPDAGTGEDAGTGGNGEDSGGGSSGGCSVTAGGPAGGLGPLVFLLVLAFAHGLRPGAGRPHPRRHRR